MSLPHDPIRERRVLALLLLRGEEALLRLPAAVTDDSFHVRHHQAIYRAVRALDTIGKRWFWADVATWLDAHEPTACKLLPGGSSSVVYEITTQDDALLEAIQDDVDHLVNCQRLRQTLLALDRAREAALRPGAESDAVTAQALQALGTVADVGHQDETTPAKRLIHDRLKAMDARIKSPNPQPGRLTRIGRLDELTGGLHPGQLVVLAGMEGDGKSALAAQIAADGAAPFLYCSLEMSRAEVQDRLMIQQARVRADNFDAGVLGRDAILVTQACERLLRIPYEVSDRSDLTIDQIRWLARRWHARTGRAQHALVVVDYLQLCTVPSELRGKAENREREVAHISRTLKKLALETGLIVVALSQLNDDGRLRESRAIGQDADLVLRIDEVKGEKDLRDLRILKGRRTRKGSAIRLRFRGEILRFEQVRDGVPDEAPVPEPTRRNHGRSGWTQ